MQQRGRRLIVADQDELLVSSRQRMRRAQNGREVQTRDCKRAHDHSHVTYELHLPEGRLHDQPEGLIEPLHLLFV